MRLLLLSIATLATLNASDPQLVLIYSIDKKTVYDCKMAFDKTQELAALRDIAYTRGKIEQGKELQDMITFNLSRMKKCSDESLFVDR